LCRLRDLSGFAFLATVPEIRAAAWAKSRETQAWLVQKRGRPTILKERSAGLAQACIFPLARCRAPLFSFLIEAAVQSDSSVAALAGSPLSARVKEGPRWLGWNFALAIFTSAFLLFQVQPIISKFILPWFGGTPAVWTTCMLFFQTVLFCGYLYAHLSQRFLSPRMQGVVHLLLLGVAVLFLPIEPAASWKPLDSSDPAGRILGLLTVTVGLPYFLLSATGPLLQSWFSRAYENRSPYRLYALSNIGSLLALLSYPFLVEPRFDLPTQTISWSWGYGFFAALCGLTAWWLFRANPPRTAVRGPAQAAAETASGDQNVPCWWQRAIWIGLPAFASMMLLATTNHVCADLAPVPFLWIAPLTVYLLSFIICFDHDRWYQRGFWALGTIAMAVLVAANLGIYHYGLKIPVAGGTGWQLIEDGYELLSYKPDILVNFLLLFGVCMCCHGEVIKVRPSPRHLTEFYLSISFGGMLGGIFVGLVAPHIFSRFWEWNIGICGSFAIALWVLERALTKRLRADQARRKWSIRGALTCAALGGLCLLSFWISEPDYKKPLIRLRNFFGVVSVREIARDNPSRHHFSFRSGTIDHGKQLADPARRNEPVSYFYPESGAGQTLLYAKQMHPHGVRVGVIGMGMGIIAAYGRAGDSFRFYEINPNVLRLANDNFYFLRDLQANGGSYEVVLGDGRLALEREPSNQFDVLMIDAFSGDAPPLHLLTKEAFEIYDKHLAPGGIICINAKNTYINIVPVVQQAARHFGWTMTRIAHPSDMQAHLYYRTDWLEVARKRDDFASTHPDILPDDDVLEPQFEVPLWTDKYTNLFGILKTK
jgi:hypothetical protein